MNLAEMAAYSMMMSGWPNSTGSPLLARMALTVPALSDFDLVHHLHGLDDAQGVAFLDRLPTSTKGLAPGDEER